MMAPGSGNERTRNLSRRAVFRWSAGLLALSAIPGQAARADDTHTNGDLSEQAREQIHELARRLGSPDATVLPEGTVVIDGWYLPGDYVKRIGEISGT